MVEQDMKKTILHELPRVDYDCLVMDFLVERMDVFITKKGEGFTISPELVESGFSNSLPEGEIVKSGSSLHWELWEAGWEKVMAALKEQGLIDRVVINKVYWTSRIDDEILKRNNKSFSEHVIEKNNTLLNNIYKRIEKDLNAWQFMDFGDDLIACSKHQWGIAPFHYTEDYYKLALKKVDCFLLGDFYHPYYEFTRYRGRPAIRIVHSFDIENGSMPSLEYAVYFMRNGKKLHVDWYQRSPVFLIPNAEHEFDSIHIFCRLKDRKIQRFYKLKECFSKQKIEGVLGL